MCMFRCSEFGRGVRSLIARTSLGPATLDSEPSPCSKAGPRLAHRTDRQNEAHFLSTFYDLPDLWCENECLSCLPTKFMPHMCCVLVVAEKPLSTFSGRASSDKFLSTFCDRESSNKLCLIVMTSRHTKEFGHKSGPSTYRLEFLCWWRGMFVHIL